MEFRILGPLEVIADGGALALGTLQQRALLALLLIRAPEPVSRDRLIDELWGEHPPASAGHAVQVYVSGIRKTLRAGGNGVSVRSTASGYLLEIDRECVDASRFERLVGEAQHALSEDPARAHQVFDQALGLWRGRPLAELGHFEFAARAADRLEEMRALAVEGLMEARLGRGEHGELITEIRELVAAEPLRERPRRLLMLALYRAGRHAEALGAYRDAVAALDEIGLQPGPELRQLEQAILRHDASLASPTTSAEVQTDVGAREFLDRGARADRAEPDGGQLQRRESRKVVTALFCDVTGSTALGEELDPEALHDVMSRHFQELSAVIERHGGTVEKFVGDSVIAVFGVPHVREDDALRAVRAAWEIGDALPAVAEETGVALSFRTALNTGLVLSGEAEKLATGDAVNVAARLQQAAAPGEILLGAETLRLVRDAVQVAETEPLELKGKSGRVRAFRLLDVDPLSPGIARRFDVPLVGRERELDVIRSAWQRTVDNGGCHLFTLLGVAGVGKSRLVAELLTDMGDSATVLRGRCLHYGEGITFWPLLEALGLVGEPARRVLDRLSSGGAATPEELFWEVRRLLESLARRRPVILHVDDLQWAEAMLLDLLDHVVELSRGVPIFLLCTARTELLEDRPGWGGGKLNATTVLLEPLSGSECETLLDELGDGFDRELRARMISASGGNPLFLEEMAVLAHDRQTVAVPSTIQALLAARLDRLPTEERQLLEHGAVEGEVFHLTAVCALAGTAPGPGLDARLAGLVRKELIRQHPATLEGDEAFRFRHILIRDAAYDGVPKATRSDLHQRFADWLEMTSSELSELDEIAGWHLEQAIRYRRELAREIDAAVSLRAATHLHLAGRRAGERGDVAAARNLLERALALAPADSTVRATACVDLAERLVDIGDLARVDELLAEAERNPDVADLAALTRFEWMLHAKPQGATPAVEARLPRILESFGKAGDTRGLAKAHMVASNVHWIASQATAAGEELRLVADYALQAGDRGMRSRALAQYVLALIYGPSDAATLATVVKAIEEEDLGPYVAAFVDLGQCELKRLAGDFDKARRLAHRALDGFGSLGMGAVQGGLAQDLGQIELSAGEDLAAVNALTRSDAILAEQGESSLRSTTQALLADAQERLGHLDAARAAIDLSDQLSAPEDLTNYVITHRVRARLALAHGDTVAAESWARSAVEHACRTDFPRYTAQARMDLARVQSALEHPDQAAAEARAALELYESKGDRPGVTEASAILDAIGTVR